MLTPLRTVLLPVRFFSTLQLARAGPGEVSHSLVVHAVHDRGQHVEARPGTGVLWARRISARWGGTRCSW